jgi:hypothetical protein
LRALDGDLHCYIRLIPEMEKPGGQRRAAAFETRKACSKLDLIKPAGGPQGGADGLPAQGMRSAVPHVLAGSKPGERPLIGAPSPLPGAE